MRALAVLHEPDGPAGEFGAHLQERGFVIDEHVILESLDAAPQPLPSFTPYDLILVLGSVQSLADPNNIAPWMQDELDWLANAHHRGTPIFGICFGGQLLAKALGGTVEAAPEPEIGWFAMDPELPGPAGAGPWFQWHHDRFTAPAEAELLARNASSEQLFRLGRTVGTQFHPEVNPLHAELWLENGDPDYLEQYSIDIPAVIAEQKIHHEANVRQCRRLVDWYVDEVMNG